MEVSQPCNYDAGLSAQGREWTPVVNMRGSRHRVRKTDDGARRTVRKSRASPVELPTIGRFMLRLSRVLLVTSTPVLFPVSPFPCAHLLLGNGCSLKAVNSSALSLVTVRVLTSHR